MYPLGARTVGGYDDGVETPDFLQKHPVVTAIGSVVGVLGGIGGLWALWSSEPLIQWIINKAPWSVMSVQLIGTVISVLIATVALVMLGLVLWRVYRLRAAADAVVHPPSDGNQRYLSDTDTELSSAVYMMVLRSRWGTWYRGQSGVKAMDAADGDQSTMFTAALLVTDEAMNGRLEIRGRLPGEIRYEPIPKETWRLAALTVVRDPSTIWKVKVIPRHNVDPERIKRVLSYDSLIVSSSVFEALWPGAATGNDDRQPSPKMEDYVTR